MSPARAGFAGSDAKGADACSGVGSPAAVLGCPLAPPWVPTTLLGGAFEVSGVGSAPSKLSFDSSSATRAARAESGVLKKLSLRREMRSLSESHTQG